MRISRQTVLTGITGVLLVFVGMMTQYRFALIEKALHKKNTLQTGTSTQTISLTNPDQIDLSTFWEVWHYLEKDYIEPEKIDQEKMVNGAIAGMTSSLEDPYTVYLPPVENQRSGEDLAGAFYGVGIELGYVEGVLAVVAPVKGTPAEIAGVQAGDLILRVKDPTKNLDEDSTKWALNEAVDNIRGPKGTTVTFTLLRQDHNNNQPFEVDVQRDEIVVKSVELTFEEQQGKRVAHLVVSRFGERTQGEWDAAVTEILAQRSSINGIVLDLRNNPGGYFDGAIDMASEFIEDGVVVSQKDKFTTEDFNARGPARLKGIPVEILVNRGSASASEIVAGALRDQLGAQLIGEKTFGKGTVQDRREVGNGGGLHVTVARWLLPSGQWIHEEGIPVNVEIEQNFDTEEDEVLNKAIEVL